MRRLEALQASPSWAPASRSRHTISRSAARGDLLGARSSRAASRAVGFDLYMQMLEKPSPSCVASRCHQDGSSPRSTCRRAGVLPERLRADDFGSASILYKRLSAIEDEDECRALLDEIADRFGPVPGETILLADLMIVKALARRLDATAIELTRTRLAIALGPSTPVDPTKLPKGWRLDRDGRLHAVWGAEDGKSPTAAARTRLQALGARAT
jgi:transcription-repair coupling factor (superfamily II helicase)